MLLNSQEITEKINSAKREVYRLVLTSLPQETRTISNNQPNLTLKATRKRTKKIPKLVEGKTS